MRVTPATLMGIAGHRVVAVAVTWVVVALALGLVVVVLAVKAVALVVMC